ncbi:MAG: class I SAM-dependent methyltransferase [Firmicutes bacterium]|nr:class I SAM-dependent methyltransferase [Bacillota bacterium]
MKILSATDWSEYQLLDSGSGKRLERFGPYILVRPDPQILWHSNLPAQQWEKANAVFRNGKWAIKGNMPGKWLLNYQNLSFWAKLTPFKHTGIFPEQTSQWDWIDAKIRSAAGPVRVLNLFAYTGIASLVAASAGAQVTHVDASRPSIG